MVEVQACIDAHPCRADVVAIVFVQVELPAQQAGAAGCIDQPARAVDADVIIAVRGAHHVWRAGFDRAHAGALHEFDSASFDFAAQEVLEGAAFELPCRGREHAADAEFRATVEFGAAVAEEKAEAELAHLPGVEVVAQPERVGEIMRAYLDRRFADLVCRGRHRVAAPFQYAYRDAGAAVAKLQREGESGQAAADDQDVHGRRVGHGAHSPGGPSARANRMGGTVSSRRSGS
jgi:hypothetical protein